MGITGEKAEFILLLDHPLQITPAQLEKCLQQFHPELISAKVNDTVQAPEGFLGFAEVSFGKHVVRLFTVNSPAPSFVLQDCVDPAPYDPAVKKQLAHHQSHMLLHYTGSDTSILEQYVALSCVAAALAAEGVLAILNESANSSLPINLLIPENGNNDRLDYLRTLPLLLLYCGMVTYQFEDIPDVWSRTYGAEKFGLPNLALQMKNDDVNPFGLFSSVLDYCSNSKKPFLTQHIFEYAAHVFSVRAPKAEEYFLADKKGQLFVLEQIR